jgi:dienelactone hydrolase
MFVLTVSSLAMSESQRHDQVDWMTQNLPSVPSWSEWQAKTGALPPDFDALASENFLPDPFKFQDGRMANMPADWPARRTEIRRLLEQYVIGRIPPKPALGRIVLLSETRGTDTLTRVVRLEYGPGNKATTQVSVTMPADKGPFPVLIASGWTSTLIRRGYISCSFSGSVDEVTNLRQLYPDYNFATMGQRAWTVQLVVDYLLTLPQVDKTRIAITGYSREGKMATIATALDERIAAVIAGSTGVGGVLPWRLMGEHGMGESIESTTRMFPLWFIPELRFFAGHEDRLPVDANLLTAMIAPRACLMQYGHNDEVSCTWANEQCFHSAGRVYQALGATERLGLLRIPGFHGSNDQSLCLDWLDIQFGRSTAKWDDKLLFPWSLENWMKRNPKPANIGDFSRHGLLPAPSSLAELEQRNAETRRSIAWLLGEAASRMPEEPNPFLRFAPKSSPTHPATNPGQFSPDVPAWVHARNIKEFGWTSPDRDAVESRRIRFGNGTTGDLYLPAAKQSGAKLPVVIWLHGYSYPLGYMWVYRTDTHPILALAKAGYAVLAFDQSGFGSRMAETAPFYDRWPRWSQFGKLVSDVSDVIDALEKESDIDSQRVSVLGYTLGGAVALHSAALDPRIKCVVSVSGFTPMRSDSADRSTGGLARFCQQRPLLPRLGYFLGHEAEVPYDYDELISLISPRPALIVQPSMDRDANVSEVRDAVSRARKAYDLRGAGDKLNLDEPIDYQRLSAATQDRVILWLNSHL